MRLRFSSQSACSVAGTEGKKSVKEGLLLPGRTIIAKTLLRNLLPEAVARRNASSAALSDCGEPSMATSIFLLRLSIVFSLDHTGIWSI